MRLLNPTIHGYIDYAIVVLFFLAPTLFGFTDETAITLCYVLGTAHLFMSLITAYPLGLFKRLPLTVHGWLEFMVGILLLALPTIGEFGYDDPARTFFMASGVGVLIVWAISDYKVGSLSDSWAVHHGLARG